MPIVVTCKHCDKSLRVQDDVAGRKIRCPACQNVFAVPAGVPPAEPASRPVRASREPAESRETSRPTRTNPERPTSRRARTSRDYIHAACESTTTIDGPEFQALADPLAKMQSTWCAECEDHFPISEFSWADTRERISDYYSRYQQQASPAMRFVASRAGMFTFAVALFFLGVPLAMILRSLWGLAGGVVGAVLAIVLHVTVLGPMVLRRVLGTEDPRQLQ